MLIVQSFTSIILASFADLIRRHPSVIYFLTMIAGAAGNAGGQSVVLAVRSIALGKPNPIKQEIKVGFVLAACSGITSLLRTLIQGVTFVDSLAIALSVCAVVFSAVIVGTTLPRLFFKKGIDPAHSVAATGVITDTISATVTCVVSLIVIDVFGGGGGSAGQTASHDHNLL